MMSTDHEGLEARLAQLEKRLRHIEDERDIAVALERHDQPIDFKGDIFAGHDSVVGHVNQFCAGKLRDKRRNKQQS